LGSDHPTVTSSALNALSLVGYLPGLLTFSLALLSISSYVRIRAMGKYISRLEPPLGYQNFGWEQAFAQQPYTISLAYLAAWVSLAAIDVRLGVQLSEIMHSMVK
jgi:hypothetical protein